MRKQAGNSHSLLIIGSVCLAAACTPRVFSPPAHTLPLESAATVGARRTTLLAEGSDHGDVFGPEIVAGAVRVSHGLTETLDVNAQASLVRVVDAAEYSSANPNITSGRVGLKLNPERNRYFSVTGGVGGGNSAGGSFVAADVGAIIAFENCYVVPFWSGQVFVSKPINAREIDLSQTGDEMVKGDTPKTTRGFTLGGGLKVPVGGRCGEPRPAAFVAGASVTELNDGETDAGIVGLGVGMEVGF